MCSYEQGKWQDKVPSLEADLTVSTILKCKCVGGRDIISRCQVPTDIKQPSGSWKYQGENCDNQVFGIEQEQQQQ